MELIKKEQITEISIERKIYFTLLVDNIKYDRIVTTKVVLPFLGSTIFSSEPKIKWYKWLSENTEEELTKKEIQERNLEDLFQQINNTQSNKIL